MSQFLPAQIIGTATITIPIDKSVSAVVLANVSPYSLQVIAGSTQSWLPGWTVDRYNTGALTGWGGGMRAVPFTFTSAVNPPESVLLTTTYGAGESVPGTYPYSLFRQANVGNAGGLPVGSADNIVNISSPVQTQIIEAVPSGGAPYNTDTVQLYNDGQFVLNLLHRGVQITGFSIIPGNGAGNRLQWNFGQSTQDTQGTIEGDLLLFGNTLGVLMSIINGAITMSVKPTLQAGVGLGPGNANGSITQIKAFIGTTGAAGPPSNVVIAHGCSVAPNAILVLPFGAAGPIMSYDTVTATQVTIRSSNTINQVFNGLAVVF